MSAPQSTHLPHAGDPVILLGGVLASVVTVSADGSYLLRLAATVEEDPSLLIAEVSEMTFLGAMN